MPTKPSGFRLSAVDLVVLSLRHRVQAERSASPAEQTELHRVADIYEALASIDLAAPCGSTDEIA